MTAGSPMGTERRRSPRLPVDLPVELSLPVGDTKAPARICDMSLSGIRCVTDRPVRVMTQVGLLLVLPQADTAIDCRGAVVRSRKLSGGDGRAVYETAIFFTSMAEPDRVELQEFLQSVRDRNVD